MGTQYTDFHFNNVQLMKLVSTAEILFQHLYDSVPPENKIFIDQWFCYKQEFDETCASNSQFDINENIPESSVLAPIDEVSENEKLSSVSSSASSFSESCISLVKSDNNNYLVAEDNKNTESKENQTPSEVETQISQFDTDLADYINDFKFSTDDYVFNWFKTMTFNTSEIREYLNWLENKEHKRIWTNLYNIQKKTGSCNAEDINDNIVENDNMKEDFSFETSHSAKKSKHQNININLENNQLYAQYNNNRTEPIDQQIRHLQEVRQILLSSRENINHKFKKNEMKSSTEFKHSLKIDVAFEIIDTSIEMKNRLKLGYDVQDLCIVNDEVDSVIADCLRVLSLKEVRHLLMVYLRNVIDMRKCSSECDKQLLKLDSEISNQKFLIWRLYRNMMVNENKQTYENPCLTLHKELEQKLQLIGSTTTDDSNDSAMESISGAQGRKLLSIIEKNDASASSYSERDSKDAIPLVPIAPNIPEKSLRMLQSASGTSSGTKKVILKKKKFIIQTRK